MSDFLHWDNDIDLDILLGDYTEYDPDPSNSEPSDEECISAKKKKILTENKTLYKCPVCDKNLKTISGFRGHVSKQHGKNLRASDHRSVGAIDQQSKTSTFNI